MVKSATGEATSASSPTVRITGTGNITPRPDDSASGTTAQGMGLAANHSVAINQVLRSLDSPELRHQLGVAQAREQQFRWQLEQQTFSEQLQKKSAGLSRRL